MTVQLLASEDSLLDIQADIDGPGVPTPARPPTTPDSLEVTACGCSGKPHSATYQWQ